jgi:hypothetical protein
MLGEDMSSATQHSIDGPSQAPDHRCVGHRKSSSQGKFLRSLVSRHTVSCFGALMEVQVWVSCHNPCFCLQAATPMTLEAWRCCSATTSPCMRCLAAVCSERSTKVRLALL